MSALNTIFTHMVNECAVSLADLFDRSFETKSFDGKPWKNRKHSRRGSILVDSGALRRSIKYKVNGNTITFTSNLPYAKIQNEGGEIKVTAKMKKYFWAMYYMYSSKVKRVKKLNALRTYAKQYKKNIKGSVYKGSREDNKSARLFKALALKPVGSVIKIPERRFIGGGKATNQRIVTITRKYMDRLAESLFKQAHK